MKTFLITLCLGLSVTLPGQSFRWDDDGVREVDPTATVTIDYTGIANVYPDYYDGNPTALGEIFYQEQLTAAHKKLPLGTIIKVTRLDNGQSTTVRVNDRGAYCDGCVIDLSQAAARQLNLAHGASTEVRLEVMGASSTTPEAYATTAGLDAQPRLTARTAATSAPPTLTATPPPPNAYQENREQLTARTPFSDKTAVVPVESARAATTNTPQVQAKGTADNPTAAPNLIDLPISPFSVQLGAYSNYNNAQRHALRLQQQGFNNVFILNEPTPGNTALHRVIVAPFDTYAAAAEYVSDLAYHHNIKGLVMQTKLIEVE